MFLTVAAVKLMVERVLRGDLRQKQGYGSFLVTTNMLQCACCILRSACMFNFFKN